MKKNKKEIEIDSLVDSIPLDVTIELGKTSISLKDFQNLNEGTIIELEKMVGESFNLVMKDQIIADGHLVAINNNYGLRINNIYI